MKGDLGYEYTSDLIQDFGESLLSGR